MALWDWQQRWNTACSTAGHIMPIFIYSNKLSQKLTKKPAQKGQDCLTRGDEVKARLVKLKASTMAPRARWHKPRYSRTRALVRPDIPLRLPDKARDPDIEATLLESDGEGMMANEIPPKLLDYMWLGLICEDTLNMQLGSI